ncbi:hypothetical protein ACH5RR_006868 [Cinchona calisaya]|uniref:Uncharacterized protein n=1 Tax=Cinchona calisaya TaxID=153742 RepID=A0ABD3AQ59_9GENT
MLQRQDSLLSSSHRQTPPPENHHAKPLGCMSSFFKLFSRYQKRNKLLTFGRKHGKGAVSNSAKAKALMEVEQKDSSSVHKEDAKNVDKINQNFETKRLTCDIMTPRSPMLLPEIRRPNALISSDNNITPPALVVQLMGLEERHQQQRQPPDVNRNTFEEENIPTEEKRKLILQALEKCNQDLESLKKTIMAVQSDEKCLQSPSPSLMQHKLKEESLTKTCMKRTVEHLNGPVSALEELRRYCHPTKSNSNGNSEYTISF